MQNASNLPTQALAHNGEDWVAIRTGGSTSPTGYSMGVLFLGQTTGLAAFGRLRGIRLDDFARVAPDRLQAALIAALSDAVD